MTFESRIVAFSERFLSQRAFDLIVAPALADLQFDEESGRRNRLANRLAVIRAVCGGMIDQARRDAGSLLALTLLPACYYLVPLALCFDQFKTWSDFFAFVMLIVVLSMAPVMVCFWPARRVRPSE